MLKLTTNDIEAPEITQALGELAREGARRVILAALSWKWINTSRSCANYVTNWITQWRCATATLKNALSNSVQAP